VHAILNSVRALISLLIGSVSGAIGSTFIIFYAALHLSKGEDVPGILAVSFLPYVFSFIGFWAGLFIGLPLCSYSKKFRKFDLMSALAVGAVTGAIVGFCLNLPLSGSEVDGWLIPIGAFTGFLGAPPAYAFWSATRSRSA
jgi:hypothetical protein